MARTFNGTSQSIECATPITGAPFTMSCWFRPTSNAGVALLSIGINGGTDRFQMSCIANSTPVTAAAVQSGTTGQSVASGTAALDTWHHGAAVFTSSTSRIAYFNGTAGAENTTSAAPSGVALFNIAARWFTALGGFFPGSIAEVVMWNAALSASEIASLAKGFNPRLIRPQNCVYLNRLIRESQDIERAATLTDVGGATTVATHPRLIYS
jgi:hypothetical protein